MWDTVLNIVVVISLCAWAWVGFDAMLAHKQISKDLKRIADWVSEGPPHVQPFPHTGCHGWYTRDDPPELGWRCNGCGHCIHK